MNKFEFNNERIATIECIRSFERDIRCRVLGGDEGASVHPAPRAYTVSLAEQLRICILNVNRGTSRARHRFLAGSFGKRDSTESLQLNELGRFGKEAYSRVTREWFCTWVSRYNTVLAVTRIALVSTPRLRVQPLALESRWGVRLECGGGGSLLSSRYRFRFRFRWRDDKRRAVDFDTFLSHLWPPQKKSICKRYIFKNINNLLKIYLQYIKMTKLECHFSVNNDRS